MNLVIVFTKPIRHIMFIYNLRLVSWVTIVFEVEIIQMNSTKVCFFVLMLSTRLRYQYAKWNKESFKHHIKV